jgi:hypothetical protein
MMMHQRMTSRRAGFFKPFDTGNNAGFRHKSEILMGDVLLCAFVTFEIRASRYESMISILLFDVSRQNVPLGK